LSFFFGEPLLSDDYYRYIWDGALVQSGINPAAYTPQEIIHHPDWLQVPDGFFEKLNSPGYYAVYPPVAQGIFYLSFRMNGWNVDGHILLFRILLLLAELIILRLLWLLLKQRNLPENRLWIYGLNPLILVEFTGNLHFDGLMILGLLTALYFAIAKKYLLSSLSMTFSILVKLITLPLIPFLGKELSWKNRILFGFLMASVIGLCFFLSFGQEANWIRSISLWFNQFEFNAGLYYALRAIGYAWKGYNTISIIGPFLLLMLVGIYSWILIRFYKRENAQLAGTMLLVLTLYFLFSTTVHPWYIGILLALSVLSLHTFPIIWSYLVFLSYSHYDGGLFAEHYFIITAEYILLGLFMLLEFKKPGWINTWNLGSNHYHRKGL